MSIKRYQMQESAFGPFVSYKDFFKLESDYAALESRHTALVEAVKTYLFCLEAYLPSAANVLGRSLPAERLRAARAEVDRLLGRI